jgi:hypothetical protein
MKHLTEALIPPIQHGRNSPEQTATFIRFQAAITEPDEGCLR